MDQVRHVINCWNDDLARIGQRDVERPSSVRATKKKLLKNDRPVCAVARPHFVGDSEMRRHRHVVDVIA